MPFPWAAAIPAAASLVGSLFGGKEKRGPSFNEQLRQNNRMIDSTMGATMRAAEAHGVHPLYALGAPLQPAINFTAGGGDREPRVNRIMRGVQDMGQNIGRAIHAAGTPEEREFAKITAARSRAWPPRERAS